MSVKLVNEATALLSMRESDFDAYSAYGEAIDNSIQAEATKIHMEFSTEQQGRGYQRIEKIAFIDNGHGMEGEIIHRCLQLGYSSRFNDRAGIGRFGVGMTLGAIHECQRVDVYSKTVTSGGWYTTHIDLSHLTLSGGEDVTIPDPIQKDPPKSYLSKLDGATGTIVIWSKYDRQSDSADKILERTKVYMGRTFRRFIWNGVEIFLNGETVHAVDPLYATVEKTKFPEDAAATTVEPIFIDWEVPSDIAEYEGQKSKIVISLSLLPEFLRKNQGAGNSSEVRSRHVHENQGISITRHGREVFYGPIPYWPGDGKWFSEIDRFWGCEVEFHPLLDRCFTVKNIKRGAVPEKILKGTIFDAIKPTIAHFLEEVRRVWAESKVEREREKQNDENEHDTGHGDAEKIVDETPTDITSLPVDDREKAEQDLLDRLKRDRDAITEAAWLAKWRSQPFTIEEDQWKGKEFIELKPLGGNDVLLYNSSHSFMSRISELIKELQEQDDSRSKELARELKCLIDLLLISYAKAESKFSDEKTSDVLEMLRINWGQYLKSYLKGFSDDEEI